MAALRGSSAVGIDLRLMKKPLVKKPLLAQGRKVYNNPRYQVRSDVAREE
jgi:hypothetical protein